MKKTASKLATKEARNQNMFHMYKYKGRYDNFVIYNRYRNAKQITIFLHYFKKLCKNKIY